jgi:hypothetical protein
MFLNYSTGANHLVGKVRSNGTNIMLFGHVSERYPERLGRVQEITKVKWLKYNNLLNRAIKITEENYNKLINPTKDKVRHAIRDEIHLMCEDGNHFIIDLSLLVTGTMVGWNPCFPKVVEAQYKDLVNKRIIKENDKILTFETMATTIRLANDDLECFSKQPTVAYFNFPERITNVKKEDIVYMTEFMLKDQETMISPKAMKLIKRYSK